MAIPQSAQFGVSDSAPVIQKTLDTVNQKRNRVARSLAVWCRCRCRAVTRMMQRMTCVPTYEATKSSWCPMVTIGSDAAIATDPTIASIRMAWIGRCCGS
ncbi:hypothetical protein KBX53_22205 [Micromonospora sp. M51]|nr:hypothetical protein [Micromonospora sp. M51]MBQ1013611.1 hypothetical protein [Micromonospora sp. M51]